MIFENLRRCAATDARIRRFDCGYGEYRRVRITAEPNRGVTSRPISYKINDDTTEANFLNKYGVVTIARAEFVGRPLETIHITAKWLQFGVDDNVQTLRAPQQVSTGTGQNLGRWTIKQLREGRSQLIHNGQAMVTDVQLELEEYLQ